MAKILFEKGSAYKKKGNVRASVDAVDIPEFSDCCKLDCCDNVIRMLDKDTGVDSVIYILAGVVTTTTKAQFDIDKAAGTFNY